MDNNTEKEKLSVGYFILSLLIPIIGIILYFVFKDDKPIEAKSCRKGFLTGLIIYVVVIVICIITCAVGTGVAMSYY